MKKILIAILCSAIGTFAIAQKNKKTKSPAAKKQDGYPFTIIGKAEGYTSPYLLFANYADQSKVDTVAVKDENFVYKGYITESTPYVYARLDNQNNVFLLDTGTHNMIIDCKTNKGFGITNAPSQESFNQFATGINPLVEKRAGYATNPGLQDSNEAAIQRYFKSYLSNPSTHPAAAAYLVLSNTISSQGATGEQLLGFYNQLPPAARNTISAKKALQIINRNMADDIGNIAPDFTLADSAGKKITLSSYRGKNYVLVDFWATWCGPCRAEFPALKIAQDKYKSKGLVILGVSIDADYKKWKAMLAQEGFTNWTHVWDGPQGPTQVVQTLYSVPSIPRNFLLDKTGKVIARNMRGPAVESTLEELLK